MKKLSAIAVPLLLALLVSCNPTVGWDDFPKDQLQSYAPYYRGDSLAFTDERDTVVFVVEECSMGYWKDNEPCSCGHYEEASLRVEMSSGDDEVRFEMLVANRQKLECTLDDGGKNIYQYVKRTEKTNQIDLLLTPTIVAVNNRYDGDGVGFAAFAGGYGLTSFLLDGKIWHTLSTCK